MFKYGLKCYLILLRIFKKIMFKYIFYSTFVVIFNYINQISGTLNDFS
jgi:hypothetical protein